MTNFEKIRQIIIDYRKVQDRRYADYRAKEKKARERYNEIGFELEFMQKVWVDVAGAAWADADEAERKVMEVFDEIELAFEKWVMKPLDASAAQTLDCIQRFGLKLSLSELQVLEKAINNSYLGLKVFAGLCEKNGYHASVPVMKEYQDALRSARSSARLAIRAYAGSPDDGYPGTDLLQKWIYQGVDYGEYQQLHLYMAYNFLHEGGELDQLEAMWGEACAPMTYSLTSEEAAHVKKKVKSIFDSFGDLVPKEADELFRNDPEIIDKLQSIPDYEEGKKLEEYILSKNQIGKKPDTNESRIDTESGVAIEYGIRLGKVDESILNNHK